MLLMHFAVSEGTESVHDISLEMALRGFHPAEVREKRAILLVHLALLA